MNIKQTFLSITICVLALTGCRLEGNVSEDGVGISNVLVKVSDPITGMTLRGYTDSHGDYSVGSTAGTLLSYFVEPICEDGTSYTVSFSKTGYIFNNPPSVTICKNGKKSLNVEGADMTVPGAFVGDAVISTPGDLERLAGTTVIGGDLIIRESTVTDLDGTLSSLRKVCGKVIIESNPSLVSIGGLSSLIKAWGNVTISDNASLSTMDGLALKEFGLSKSKILTLSDNPMLTNLKGFDHIVDIDNMTLKGNDALATLEDLESLTSITNSLVIEDNDALTDLKGLGKIQDTFYWVWIIGNGSLKTLSGFDAVESIFEFTVADNPALSDIGMANLKSVDKFTFTDNPELCTSMIHAFLDGLIEKPSNEMWITISGNKDCP
jgi:hypothetical protein